MRSSWLGGLVAATLSLSAVVSGQPSPLFKARIGLVVLHATVKNGRGELVTTLDRDAFAVYEDGKRQPVTLFGRDDVPVSLGLIIDNSGSMRGARSRVEAAALELVNASNPQDEVFVINFADRARLDVPLTRDARVLEKGIARVDSIGGTALRDAVDMGETYLQQHASNARRVLVILSDGNDNASMIPVGQVQQLAERSEIAIYAIGLVGTASPEKARDGRRTLEELTKPTGGVALYPSEPDDIDSTALDLARQIRSQYTIAYAPLNQSLDGRYRSIRVEARGRERLVVITRTGYRATSG